MLYTRRNIAVGITAGKVSSDLWLCSAHPPGEPVIRGTNDPYRIQMHKDFNDYIWFHYETTAKRFQAKAFQELNRIPIMNLYNIDYYSKDDMTEEGFPLTL